MMRHIRNLISTTLIAVALVAMPGVAAAAGEQTITNAVTSVATVAGRLVEVRTSVTVRNVTKDEANNLTIVVPPTVLDQLGTQKVLAVKFTTEPTSTRETPAGIEATYKFGSVPAGAVLTFEQVYTVELAQGAEVITEEQIDARYLQPEAGIESDNAEIKARARALTLNKKTTTAKVEAIATFVVDRLSYDLASTSRNKGALAGYENGTGVCSEYASLFVAMARASGIPARLVYGWARDTGLEGALNAQVRHVWAEYYDAEKGWVAIDPTFAEAQSDVLAFDAANHIAQDWSNSTLSASFGGRGILSVVAAQTLTPVTTAQR